MEECQYVEKMDKTILNELKSEHKAILMIVNALNHGKSIDEVLLGICLKHITERNIEALSKAFQNLADEICFVKNVESITTGYDSDEFNENFLQKRIKLFVSAAETTHISVGEMFALLHPIDMPEIEEAKSMNALPICCSDQRTITVSTK